MLRDTLKLEIESMSESQLEELAVLIRRIKVRTQQSIRAESETKPLWQHATPQARAEELLNWSAKQSHTGISLPDEAFDRDTIYN